MTPQEKAVELVDWFMPMFSTYKMSLEYAKKCAVKVCEEILEADPYLRLGSYAANYYKEVIEQIKAVR